MINQLPNDTLGLIHGYKHPTKDYKLTAILSSLSTKEAEWAWLQINYLIFQLVLPEHWDA